MNDINIFSMRIKTMGYKTSFCLKDKIENVKNNNNKELKAEKMNFLDINKARLIYFFTTDLTIDELMAKSITKIRLNINNEKYGGTCYNFHEFLNTSNLFEAKLGNRKIYLFSQGSNISHQAELIV